jgi:membrane protease YdiL (CAAX protease family)
MKQLQQRIKQNATLSVITAVAIGFAIFFMSGVLKDPVFSLLDQHLHLPPYWGNVVLKFFMLVLSIGTILLLNKGNLKSYGFQRSKNIRYIPFVLKVSAISAASFIFSFLVFMVLLSNLFPTANHQTFENENIVVTIFTVWIWSSLCEEVLVRGVVQGFIQHLRHIKIFKLSLPVVVSGLFFGSLHAFLFLFMSCWFAAFIVFDTIVMGMVAAYYREKSESIIPAFWVHFIANVIGCTPLLFKFIF